jgi:excisionase family DNA binding protein
LSKNNGTWARRGRTVGRGHRQDAQQSEDIWSPVQLAEYVGLAPNTIYALLARGAIPGQCRLGRRWRISKIAFLRSIHGEPETAEAAGGQA